jgi:hypothetical protein
MILIIPISLFLGKKAAIWVFFSICVEILRLLGHAGEYSVRSPASRSKTGYREKQETPRRRFELPRREAPAAFEATAFPD